MGYKKVFAYLGGFPEWKKRGLPVEMLEDFLPAVETPVVSPAEFKVLLDGPEKVVLLDIRDSEDVALTGTIKGAIRIPLESLMARYEQLPKGQKVLVFDLRGNQIPIAGRYLVKQSHPKVIGLAGGAEAWVKAGLPTTK